MDDPSPMNLDTSIPRSILKKLPSQRKRTANPMLRPTSPVANLSQFSDSVREAVAKGVLQQDGYARQVTTPVTAYNSVAPEGRGAPTLPAAGLLPSWRKHLPSTPEAAGPSSLNGPRSHSASAVLTGKKGTRWSSSSGPSGIHLDYKGPAFGSRQKIKALVKEARELSEHVSDTTMKQIEYFMTSSPPPLSAAEATRRLGVDPPLPRRDSDSLSGHSSNTGARPRKEASAKSTGGVSALSSLSTDLLPKDRIISPVTSPKAAPDPQGSSIMVVRREKQAFGGGFKGRKRLDLPKWKEHGRLLAEAQKAMSSAMAAMTDHPAAPNP